MSNDQFGPSALMTPANLVTISRLLLTMPFLGMVVAVARDFHAYKHERAERARLKWERQSGEEEATRRLEVTKSRCANLPTG